MTDQLPAATTAPGATGADASSGQGSTPSPAGGGAGTQASPSPSAGAPPANPPTNPPADPWDGFRRMAGIEAEKLQLKSQLDQIGPELKRLQELEAGLKDRSKRYQILEGYGADLKEWSQRKLNDGEPGIEETVRSLEERIEQLTGALSSKAKEDEEFQDSVMVGNYARELRGYLGSESFLPVRQYEEFMEAFTGQKPNLEADLRAHLKSARDPQTGQPIPPEKTAQIMVERAKAGLESVAKLPWFRDLVLAQQQQPTNPPPSAPATAGGAPAQGAPGGAPAAAGRAPAPPVGNAGETAGGAAPDRPLSIQDRLRLVAEKLQRASEARRELQG